MRHYHGLALIPALALAVFANAADLRIGMIGMDTGHSIIFTEALNNPNAKDHVPGARVVAAYKVSSPDIESSWSRVGPNAEKLRKDREGNRNAGKAVGEKGESTTLGRSEGYRPLVQAIVTFFQTGISPVPEQETIEIMAFMEADVLSKARGGQPVKIAEVMKQPGEKARKN